VWRIGIPRFVPTPHGHWAGLEGPRRATRSSPLCGWREISKFRTPDPWPKSMQHIQAHTSCVAACRDT